MADRELSIREAATVANCHPETIRRAIRNKELLATRHPIARGRGYVISVHDLKAFLDKRRIA